MLVLDCLGAVFGARLALFFAGLQEDDSDAARRSPCEGGLAIHTGLLDLSLGHDHGDVSDHDRRPPSPQRARQAPYPVARRRQAQPHANPKARSTGCRSDKQ